MIIGDAARIGERSVEHGDSARRLACVHALGRFGCRDHAEQALPSRSTRSGKRVSEVFRIPIRCASRIGGELGLAHRATFDGLNLKLLAGEELVGAGVNVLEEENLLFDFWVTK